MIHAEFYGLYNVIISFKDKKIGHKEYKRVEINNEQFRLGNLQLTNESQESILIMKSDIKRVEFRASSHD